MPREAPRVSRVDQAGSHPGKPHDRPHPLKWRRSPADHRLKTESWPGLSSNIDHHYYLVVQYMGVSINGGITPKIIHFNGIFHEINHPFGGFPILGNFHITVLSIWCFGLGLSCEFTVEIRARYTAQGWSINYIIIPEFKIWNYQNYILFIVYYTIIKKCINYNTILIMKYEILVLYMIVLHWDHAASSKIIKVETVSECSSPGGIPVSRIAHVVGKCDIVWH